MADWRGALQRVDAYQRAHAWAGVPFATVRKFLDDKTTAFAAMIAFWAFFSIFPLFLAFVTLLGYLLPADQKNDVLDKVSSMFPLIEPSTVGAIGGNWWALVLGLATALWSGTGVIRNVQYAFNSIWEIPRIDRPKMLAKLVRSLIVLATLGLGIVASTFVTGFVSSTADVLHIGSAGRVGGYLIAVVLDVGLFLAAFKVLTDKDVTIRQVLPGAAFSGVGFFVLQSASSLIISRYLQNAQGTYASFATVITILWWFYLQSILTLLGAQVNVVLTQGLWPRSLRPPETEADRRAYEAYAAERSTVRPAAADTASGP